MSYLPFGVLPLLQELRLDTHSDDSDSTISSAFRFAPMLHRLDTSMNTIQMFHSALPLMTNLKHCILVVESTIRMGKMTEFPRLTSLELTQFDNSDITDLLNSLILPSLQTFTILSDSNLKDPQSVVALLQRSRPPLVNLRFGKYNITLPDSIVIPMLNSIPTLQILSLRTQAFTETVAQ
ncbi:hypothetical protein C8J56DRAFT_1041755 [Mycena floridula]|nr:hypothetical protein C8J56DRAFT_1041755 [Mycena floridula]